MSVIFNNSLLGCLGYGRKHRLVSWWFALLLNKYNSLIFFIFSVFSLLSCSKPSYGAVPSRLWHNCHMAKRKAFSYVCRQHWKKCDTARPPPFRHHLSFSLKKHQQYLGSRERDGRLHMLARAHTWWVLHQPFLTLGSFSLLWTLKRADWQLWKSFLCMWFPS